MAAVETPGLTALDTFLQGLTNQIKDLQAQVDKLKEKDAQLEKKDKELDAKVKQAEDRDKALEDKDKQIEKDIKKLEKDDEKHNAIDAELAKDIAEIKGEIKEIKFEIKRLGGRGVIYGGDGGVAFAGVGKQITAIKIETDEEYLDSIQFALDGKDYSSKFGKRKGKSTHEIKCAQDEYFNKVTVLYSTDNYSLQGVSKKTTVIGGITFATNKGHTITGGVSPSVGTMMFIEAKGILAGVNGRSGTLVDQLQFEWRAN